MKNYSFSWVGLFLFYLFFSQLLAAGDAFDWNMRLGRGLNLGNALEAPNEGDWGLIIKQKHLQAIKEAGFDSVRLPVRWSAHMSHSTPYEIDTAFLSRVDEIIHQAMALDLNVVLDVQHFQELEKDVETYRPMFLAIWKQLADHYADYPEYLYFELLNQPGMLPQQWESLFLATVPLVREKHPNRPIIIGPVYGNRVPHLPSLKIPSNFTNIIVTVHIYTPIPFTRQGADYMPEADQWLGTHWGSNSDRDILRKYIQTAKYWSDAWNRPIYVGEFGAWNEAPGTERDEWVEFVRETSEEYGFSWAYWSIITGFGPYNIETDTWNELLPRLIPPNIAGK